MTQNRGDEKVLAIPALFACYETKPNALACARNEKVACSSQVTSSIKTAAFMRKRRFSCVKKLRSPFGHRFYPVIFPSITNSTRTAAKMCPNFLCFFSQQSGFWHQDIIKHFRRSSLHFFHERDLLIIVVVWSANHFRYNGV